MPGIRTIAFVALYLSSAFGLAAPDFESSRERIARSRSRVLNGQFNLNQAVNFQTVTNTQTQVGIITEKCQVRLTPVSFRGQDVVKQDKACQFQVTPFNNNLNQNQNQNNNNNNNFNNNNSLFSSATLNTQTLAFTNTQVATFSTIEAAPLPTLDTAEIVPAISEVGFSSVAATEIGNPQATFLPNVPAISELGTSFIQATGTFQALTTLIPTAAAAQESQPAAAQVPGRKLEVLPIGLGVFAGISVIALIVVGLVTYERTKYRKAFRQRKLAEAGANMGYGGMAERT